MITILRGLAGKELRQHRASFAWLSLVSIIFAWLIVRFMLFSDAVLSDLQLVPIFAWPALVFIALGVGYFLVTQEYYSRTQRFIEALPFRPAYMVSVKYAIGLVVVSIFAFSVWGYSMYTASFHEPLEFRFSVIMATRLGAYVFVVWSCVFVFSLLGRWRIPLASLAAVALFFISTETSLELNRFGPVALIDQELFSFERDSFPLAELGISLAIGVIAIALAFLLMNVDDGSYVESLAVPMSTRDKSFLFVLVVVSLGMIGMLEPPGNEQNFAFTQEHVIAREKLEIAYLDPKYEQDAITLADQLKIPLSKVESYLPFNKDEYITRISLSPIAKSKAYSTRLASTTQGIRVDANFIDAPGWNFPHFGIFVVHQLLSTASLNRVILEPSHWFLDGFSSWLVVHNGEPPGSLDTPANDLLVLAMYVSQRVNIDEKTITQWETTSDRIGESLGLALSYSGWRVLEDLVGHDTVRQFAESEFRREVHGDIRDWWSDWRKPFTARFESATGLSWPGFVEQWRNQVEQLARQEEYASRIAAIPVARYSVTGEVNESGQRVLKFNLELEKALASEMSCTALHRKLPGYNIPVAPNTLRKDEFTWPVGQKQVIRSITGRYGKGNRVYTALECQLMPYNMIVRFGYDKLVMP